MTTPGDPIAAKTTAEDAEAPDGAEVIDLVVNGASRRLAVRSDERLLDVLRETLNLHSVRDGCSVGMCGACTVLLDTVAISSCLALASLCCGATVVTAEGLGQPGQPDPVVQAFVEHRAFQCSYCTPGFVLAVKGLILAEPSPSPGQIEERLSGHICRCGSYSRIVEAAVASVAGQALHDPVQAGDTSGGP